jgi:hypothetical protein
MRQRKSRKQLVDQIVVSHIVLANKIWPTELFPGEGINRYGLVAIEGIIIDVFIRYRAFLGRDSIADKPGSGDECQNER